MNEVIKTIKSRRSVRKYQSRQIPRADVEQIIEAGLWAPSARNTQPWHLTVVRGQENIAPITAALKEAVARMPENPYRALVGGAGYTVNFGAPTIVIVSGHPDITPMVQADCGQLIQNMALAAHSMGIGSCWVNQLGSACNEPGFRKFLSGLGVPEGYFIHGTCALGYPEGAYPKAPLRKENLVNWVE